MAKQAYTTSEVAEKLRVSRETLYVWMRENKFPAPEQIRLGKRTHYLWTDADIQAAKKYKLKSR